MRFGICLLACIPLYANASQKSEMINQLLFGDVFEIQEISTNQKWFKIRLCFDHYEGWVDATQYTEISEAEYAQLCQSDQIYVVTTSIATLKNLKDLTTIHLSVGSTLPFFNPKTQTLKVGNQVFKWQAGEYALLAPQNRDWICQKSFLFLNIPYLWGGRTWAGMDCSGFTQIIFKIAGYRLRRDACQQATQGETIDFQDRQPADLAFFEREKRIVHVGLILPENQIMHALASVRIDILTEIGIWNTDKQAYSHYLHSIKRMIK
ncbi:MAG: C40 family peptidase [Microscillaceae bacterium]|nr:C40 family peptidase [Microscillaceae bacterium]MDW8459726.1 C40 family peptidase [Cytophagales bacterium]